MLNLVANDPLDLLTLGQLLSDKDELFLVWPDARFPFDPAQWRERLLSRPGNRSYFVADGGEIIGHAALLLTDEPNAACRVLPVHPAGSARPRLRPRADRPARGRGQEVPRS